MADSSGESAEPMELAALKDAAEGGSGEQYFEGVEKLLEVWFGSSSGGDGGGGGGGGEDRAQRDLRQIPRQKWESLLKIVRCEIISFCSNDLLDAYVLSESSMFVAKRRLILKTCGTTTPLQCLEALLDLVESYTGFDKVEDLFYSRKNYKRPELQISPHQAFEEEVSFLDSFFPDGEAFCLGSEESDCWFLYTLGGRGPTSERGPDQTLEILMSELDPEVMSIFTREVSSSAAEASRKSGIDKLIPAMLIDDFLFEPCGYSMNGLCEKSASYMTIHITPEPDFSYVSFESNVPEASYRELVERVLRTFKPAKFVLTIFANRASLAAELPRELERSETAEQLEALLGAELRHDFVRNDAQYCRFKNYDLSCAFYSKFPS